MSETATFASIDPDAETFQSLRRELGATSLGINAIMLRPRQRLRVHRHERQEEVYLVLEGELTLIVEGEEHVLGAGDLARVPGPSAASAHQRERRARRACSRWGRRRARRPRRARLGQLGGGRRRPRSPGGAAARGPARLTADGRLSRPTPPRAGAGAARLRSPVRRFCSRRRRREAAVGRVGRRLRGTRRPAAIFAARRRRASSRLRDWPRASWATAVRSGPARSSSRARWRSSSVAEAATSNTASTREAVTLACWPPGPEERLVRSSISLSGIARAARRSSAPPPRLAAAGLSRPARGCGARRAWRSSAAPTPGSRRRPCGSGRAASSGRSSGRPAISQLTARRSNIASSRRRQASSTEAA